MSEVRLLKIRRMTPFVLNDETKKNSHGFYLLNSGGQFERFNDNPVMLDNHEMDRLIGRWENLHVEGHLLLANPVFDEGTPLGAERKGQVERGFLRGASPGIIPLEAEWRKNPATGTEDLYVTRWEKVEASVTPIPSNAGALSLKIYDSNQEPVREEDVRLHLDHIVELSAQSKLSGIISKPKPMEKITLSAEALVALGVSATDSTETLSAAIVKLSADLKAANDKAEKMEKEAREALKAKAEKLVKMALDTGRITTDVKEAYTELAITNYALAEKTLDSIPEKITLSGKISPLGGSSIPQDRAKWTLLKWLREDPEGLNKIRTEEPETFEAIKKVR